MTFFEWLSNLSPGAGCAVFIVVIVVIGCLYDITFRVLDILAKKK